MTLYLRLIILFACVLILCFIIRKIRNSQIQVQDSVFWIFFAFILLLLGAFPSIAIYWADILEIVSPVNFIFLCIIFILLIKLFLLSIHISQLDDKIKRLSQTIALINHNQHYATELEVAHED